jgi:chromosome segregation ATPase
MKSSLELNNQQVAAMISETAIYKENAQKYMEEFNRVSQEYYEFRQNNIQADTRLRDMKILLQEEKKKSENLITELDALKSVCSKQENQIEKLAERGNVLDFAIKNATDNVHRFEKQVMSLERSLEREKENYSALEFDLMDVNRDMRDFKHNQYDVLKEKYENALDEAKIANNKFE